MPGAARDQPGEKLIIQSQRAWFSFSFTSASAAKNAAARGAHLECSKGSVASCGQHGDVCRLEQPGEAQSGGIVTSVREAQ